jgi:DNA-directed RNA polymerase subunit RPC12/RpoP
MGHVTEFNCPNCTADLKFDPSSGKWKCEYCYSYFIKDDLNSSKDQELDNHAPEYQDHLNSYNCTSCGAELITHENTSATFCLYCKNPTIIKNRFSGKFKPHYVIPFKLTNENSKDIYFKWIKSKFFTPKQFKEKSVIDKITGLYVPYWLFNSKIQGEISGDATKKSHYTRGNYKYTETKHYRFQRNGSNDYEKVPIDGSKKLEDEKMQAIEPFDYSELTDFSLEYMSGFLAEKYDVTADEASDFMIERVKSFFEQRLRDTVKHYSSVTVTSKNFNLSNISQSYAMLPIYILINSYKNKDYLFIVNGQTGKIYGDVPFSVKKLLIFFFTTFIIVLLICILGGNFSG